jgi:tRNA A-37 threonylcarbamoyl transferase component Bud32
VCPISQEYIRKLKQGDSFRDWIVHDLGHRIKNERCNVREFRIRPASHIVCRYEFDGEGFSVMAKFLAQPTGKIKKYDAKEAMLNEYYKLKRLEKIIDVPEPIALSSRFNCVLVTKYIPGKPFSWYLKNEKNLDEKLEAIACLLSKLHRSTGSYYDKEKDFEKIRSNLQYMHLPSLTRERYEQKLKGWQESPFLDESRGCTIHRDATPANYLFYRGKTYAIDLELSTEHGNAANDLGILCAEVFHHFARKGMAYESLPHIKRFLRNYSRDEKEYRRIKRILPLYMSYGLLRVAWREKKSAHRKYLISKAIEFLDRPPI